MDGFRFPQRSSTPWVNRSWAEYLRELCLQKVKLTVSSANVTPTGTRGRDPDASAAAALRGVLRVHLEGQHAGGVGHWALLVLCS